MVHVSGPGYQYPAEYVVKPPDPKRTERPDSDRGPGAPEPWAEEYLPAQPIHWGR